MIERGNKTVNAGDQSREHFYYQCRMHSTYIYTNVVIQGSIKS